MKTFVTILMLSFLLVCCKHKEEKELRPINMTDTITTKKDEMKALASNEQHLDTITLHTKDSEGIYKAVGTIDSIHPRIYVKFTNDFPATLKASILTEQKDANIRFNQIILSDKTMDGPFGKDLEYQLKTEGEHILIIGHSQMAEGRYEGAFKLQLKLTKKQL